MQKKILSPYVELGISWASAMRDLKTNSKKREFIAVVDGLSLYAKLCGFENSTHSIDSIKNAIESSYSDPRGVFEAFSTNEFHGYMARIDALESIFRKEAEEQECALLNDLKHDERFSDLESKMTFTDNQKQFHKEALFCIRVDALRASIVMAWQLCFDYVMVWVINDTDRLKDMNVELTKKFGFDAINSYDDYTKTKAGERVLLDTCKSKPLGENLYLPLILRLKDRNRFAHANDNVLTVAKVRAFCDEICDIIEQLDAKK